MGYDKIKLRQAAVSDTIKEKTDMERGMRDAITDHEE